MKSRILIFCLLSVAVAGFLFDAHAAPSPRHDGVIASGGGISRTPGGITLYATVGQPVVGISRNSESYYLISGYHTLWQSHISAVRHWSIY